jgi:hypothetical protein
MEVNCPNCGEKVTAENINIHKMTAVCGACDTVFQFELPETKVKRRKVKQPRSLILRDAETLQMDFRTNFRLDRNEAFLTSLFGSISLLIAGLVLIGTGDAPLILPVVFLLITSALIYRLALIVVNKTHIEMDDDTIHISRKPLPTLFNQGYEVPLAGVEAIRYEETAVSKKEGYDTPRYRVWAETTDGNRRTIVNDVTEDYAVFIAQRLEERLYMDGESDISQLEGDWTHLESEADMDEMVRASQNPTRQQSRFNE